MSSASRPAGLVVGFDPQHDMLFWLPITGAMGFFLAALNSESVRTRDHGERASFSNSSAIFPSPAADAAAERDIAPELSPSKRRNWAAVRAWDL